MGQVGRRIMGLRGEGNRLMNDGDRNPYPVTCAWCNLPLIPFDGLRVLMSHPEDMDYDWACKPCYAKVMNRE